MKRSVSVIFICLLLVSFLFSAMGVVSAAEKNVPFVPKVIEESSLFQLFINPGETSALAEVTKLILLLLAVLLIYSALSYADFPESATLRWIIAFVAGFLAIVAINPDEIVAILQSYTALGVTLSLIFPILILTFFTFVVATKGNVLGILTQRIMWMIYSVYLFIKVGALLLFKALFYSGFLVQETGGKLEGVYPFFDGLFNFFFGASWQSELGTILSSGGDNFLLVVLLIVSIVVFWIFVLNNRDMRNWIQSEKLDADVDKAKDTSKRAKASKDIYAEDL